MRNYALMSFLPVVANDTPPSGYVGSLSDTDLLLGYLWAEKQGYRDVRGQMFDELVRRAEKSEGGLEIAIPEVTRIRVFISQDYSIVGGTD